RRRGHIDRHSDPAELRSGLHAGTRRRVSRACRGVRHPARVVPDGRGRAAGGADAGGPDTPERAGPGSDVRERLARAGRSAVAMSEKPWLDAYPPGVPADIDPDEHPSLAAFLEDRFERYANLPAFTNRSTTLTFAEVERHSRALAAYLQAIPGLGRGD